MSLYLEQIRQLVALQRVDDASHSVEMELEQAPKELEDLKNRFAARTRSASGCWKSLRI